MDYIEATDELAIHVTAKVKATSSRRGADVACEARRICAASIKSKVRSTDISQLRVGGPVAEFLEALANLLIGEDIKMSEGNVLLLEDAHNF